jgi:hypothetical protein
LASLSGISIVSRTKGSLMHPMETVNLNPEQEMQ